MHFSLEVVLWRRTMVTVLQTHGERSPPAKKPPRDAASLRLPPELVSHILTLTDDWELCRTLQVRPTPATRLPTPAPWQEFATPLDRAILRSSASLVPVQFALAHGHTKFTQWGARVMIRFSLVHVLDFLFRADERQFRDECTDLLPVVASAWGRLAVLEWAKDSDFGLRPSPQTTADAIDEASRHGQVESAFRFPLVLRRCS